MALEDLSGDKYINSLVSTNPDGATDPKSQGDDHIRGIKNVIKKTFAAITGAVTASHTELNYVTGVTSAIQTQIDSKANQSAMPTGSVVGTTDTQTLTNKDISASTNTYRAASATEAGAVELATQAEVDAGTDTARAVTPATLASRPVSASNLPALSYTRTEKLDAAYGSTTRMTAPTGYFFWSLSSITSDTSGQNAGAWVAAIASDGTWVDVEVNNTYDYRYFSVVWAKFS